MKKLAGKNDGDKSFDDETRNPVVCMQIIL